MEGDELAHKDPIFEDQDDSTSTPEHVLVDDSTFSSDEATEPIMPPPKKSRRGEKKKVVLVPIGGGDGSPRSKMEVYPPPDSWSWRKYGQKPIKGSPYPRGYYRCSSSKGCPARKQVERSRVDPTMLQITYSQEHNHPIPTTTHKHHHHHRHPTTRAPPPVDSSPSTSSTSTATTDTAEESVQVKHSPEDDMLTNQPDHESDTIGFYEFTKDLEWFSNMGSTAMLNSPTFVGPKWVDADVTLMLPIGEEDQSLFGDLGELPECSMVFQRRCGGEQPTCVAGG